MPGTLHEDLHVFPVIGSDLICSATVEREDGSGSMAALSVFLTLLTGTRVRQQYKLASILHVHGHS